MPDTLDPNWIGNTEEDNIYRENILDHYKHPRNYGALTMCTFTAREHNPTCGDDVTLYVHLNDNHVKHITFTGHGCAISQAATSMLTDYAKHKTLHELKNIQPRDIIALLGITIGVARMKCALLSLTALHNAITQLEHTP